MSTTRRHIATTLVPVIALLVGGISLVIADDNEEATGASAPAVTSTLMPPSANETLFVEINAGYLKIKPAIERSCYDCHSDKTHYPWYYKLPIIKGMIDSDIKEGREHLDFSKDFPFTGKGSQADMLTDMREEIEEGAMPLRSYRITHWGRLIEGPVQDTVFNWIDSSLERLATVGIVPSNQKSKEME